ncbi:hypothetical protein [Hymenobacter guriensis]|uniref:SGNH/GDSL hydrolase family protein n=1 Tax=Hymenobacter guriensis TaxID=2793065 RepID=A0ABS0L0V0_9BACT|nr:hypothetical protein [Hymenobacter guriensis]MBG8553729.1 hypothetical protein [Hymenobacter guriensis]
MLKTFVYKAALFIILPLPFAFGLHHAITQGLLLSRNKYLGTWNDIRSSKIKSKIYISGSSRARVQFSTNIIDSMLHTNSYNLGMEGYQFSMQDYRLKMALKYNPKPKCIVQVLDFFSLHDRSDLFEYQQFLPYLSDSSIIGATQQYKGRFNWFQIHVPLYRYNSEAFLIKEGINNYIHQRPTVIEKINKNYAPQDKKWDGKFEEFKAAHPRGEFAIVDYKAKAKFLSFLMMCQAKNIKLILVYPPEYSEFQSIIRNRKEIIDLYTRYANDFNIPFLDYSNHPLSRSRRYFYNSQHLNKEGAEIFTQQFCRDLTTHLDSATLQSLIVSPNSK